MRDRRLPNAPNLKDERGRIDLRRKTEGGRRKTRRRSEGGRRKDGFNRTKKRPATRASFLETKGTRSLVATSSFLLPPLAIGGKRQSLAACRASIFHWPCCSTQTVSV